MSEAEK